MTRTAAIDTASHSHERIVAAFANELEIRDPDGSMLAERIEQAELLVRAFTARVLNSVAWEKELGPVYDADGVAHLLGGDRAPVSRQAVSKRKLLALRTGSGRVVYPAFQFDEDGSVVSGVADVVKTLEPMQLSRWTLASWFVSPEPELDGLAPIVALRAGGKDAVLDVVHRWAAAL